MTARSTVNAAIELGGSKLSGALAPSQAFDPRSFLDRLGDFDVAYEVEPLDRATEAVGT